MITLLLGACGATGSGGGGGATNQCSKHCNYQKKLNCISSDLPALAECRDACITKTEGATVSSTIEVTQCMHTAQTCEELDACYSKLNQAPVTPKGTDAGSTPQQCETTADCLAGQLCAPDPTGGSSTGKACFDVKCDADSDCTNDAKCENGICVGENKGGTDGTDTGCAADADCPDGAICITDTGDCVTTSTLSEGNCSNCSTDASACGDSQVCQSIQATGGTKYCLKKCDGHATCPSGWLCGIDGKGPACVPGFYQCKGCMLDGCPDGEYCVAEKGVCAKALAVCASCTLDGECGLGKRCVGKAGNKKCVPECPSGTCKNGGICKPNNLGVPVCEWPNLDATCCLVEGCGGSQVADPCDKLTCAGSKPHCLNGACVACTKDEHCSNPKQTCDATNKCADDSQCSGETPHWNASLNKCCECSNSTHCGGKSCDGCACKESNDAFCNTCTGAYPGCANMGGQWVCVECSQDSHCQGDVKCNMETYTCEKGDNPNPNPNPNGDCKTNGCTVAGTVCDQTTGNCYSPDGSCDGKTVFCQGGQTCVDLDTKLGAAVVNMLFPEGTMTGRCSCELNGSPYWSQGTCPAGTKCGPHVQCYQEFIPTPILDYFCDPMSKSGPLGPLAKCPGE